MGRTLDFSNDNRSADDSGFPKLKLEMAEKTRVVVLEKPHCEYVHEFRAPKIENGRPKMTMRQRKDKSAYEDYDYEFIGGGICLGDESILMDKGVDPKNCPACEAAANGDAVSPPKRRFAMHIIEYETKQGSSEIAEPFSVRTKIWRFADKIFNKLVDITNEVGDLKKHDLLLGPCTSKDFQQYDIMPSGKAEWLLEDSSVDRKKRTVETFNNNQASGLAQFCGNPMDRGRMSDTVAKIRNRWKLINNFNEGKSPSPLQPDASSLADDLGDLLDVSKSTSVNEVEGVDIMAELASQGEAAKEPEISMPKPGSSGEELSMANIFDDLLNA